MKDFNAYLKDTNEVGYVDQVNQAILLVSGLPHAKPQEMILFETGETGLVMTLKRDVIEVLLFSRRVVRVGTRAARTSEFLQLGVGDELLGKTLNPLGFSLDQLNPFTKPVEKRPMYSDPLGIPYRKRISYSCETGNSMVDMVIPLGRGQRQLVIGDRKTGKTNFLLKTVLTQAKKNTICIYAAIGKRKQDIKKIEEFFIKQNIRDRTIIVGTSSFDSVGVIYLTPFSAMTIAEYFKDKGMDVLIVMDDLTTHAKFYREISLLSKRFPGRNSYPGDIFYTHARLLERAGNFKVKDKECSITCLPVVETTEGDLSGYIQTNIMAMTDGHIYFDSELFTKGRRPAVNPFLSVTRVGRQTQSVLHRDINRELLSFLTLFEKMQRFVHFGAELTPTIKSTLSNGDRILAFFQLTSENTVESNLQIFLYCLLWVGLWQGKDILSMKIDMDKIATLYKTNPPIKKHVDEIIGSGKSFNDLLGKMSKNIQYYQTNLVVSST